ncbi:DUF2169 domain-containing protein [Desulfovibrio sp. ZJ369]|uniref:DUF2169 family type VI secretion system accessory protein n=1 Tax=Desulfovibrio sp. ZJ369 TaxID=2709793 RepID=UPI0013EB98B1|nr:DUF2169 domain-containing protein [Desulfovibrio sp. ZJ369]
MHILKDAETGLLFSSFAVGGRWQLQAAVLLYFALDAPDVPLSEQRLWPEIMAVLGKDAVLDPGFPKARGEVLAAGEWCAPGGRPAPGGAVSIRVGPVRRELAVFGDRFWRAGAPSEPRPAERMPLTWAQAFGGEGCAENPLGKGAARAETPWGENARPLPNVEDPATGLMLAPDARPVPACFLPIPPDAPSRLALAGAYGAAWLAEHWPGFPADVDEMFFNLAAPAQRLPAGYFTGGEEVEIRHMHPGKAVLQSRLPRKRVRVFATRREARAARLREGRPCLAADPFAALPGDVFEECAARLETVWLFPGIERGLVLYRAVLPTADDEHSDIIRLFPVVEEADAAPTDAAHWYEEQKRRLRRVRPAAPQIPDAALAAVEKAKAAVRTAEEDVALAVDRALGSAPVLPAHGAGRIARARKQAAAALERIEDARQCMQRMRGRFGHMVKIDPRQMDALRDSVLSMLAGLDRAEADMREMDALIAGSEAQSAAAMHDLREKFAALPAASRQALAEAGHTDIPQDEALPPEELWSEAALALLARHPADGDETAALLERAGLRPADIGKAMPALLPSPCRLEPAQWGLEADVLPADAPPLPAGLLLGHFQGARCVRLAVRPLPTAENPCAAFLPCVETVFPGSREGAQLLGGTRPKPVLLAPDPLAAWLLYGQAGDLCAVLIATSPAAKPPDAVREALANAPCALWPVPPLPVEEAEDGLPPVSPAFGESAHAARAAQLAAPWTALVPGLEALAWPEKYAAPHLGAARALGLDIRAWLRAELEKRGVALPPAESEGGLSLGKDKHGRPAFSLKLPVPDATGIVRRQSDRLRAAAGAVRSDFEKSMAQGEREANALLAARGLPPLPSMPEAATMPDVPPPDPQALKIFDEKSALLRRLNRPADAQAMQELKADYMATLEKGRAAQIQGRAQLAEVRALWSKSPAQRAPAWVKDVPGAEAVLNPQAMTPDLALARLRGGDTQGLTLKGLDLSGCDLSNCAFRDMFLEDVNLSRADLTGAVFEKAALTRVNCREAALDGASLKLCSVAECGFTASRARGMRAELVQWRDCVFEDVDWQDAAFKLGGMQDCMLRGHFAGLSLELFTMTQSVLREVFFRGCRLRKCALIKSEISNFTFEDGAFLETAFTSCTGDGLRFVRSDCENLRVLLDSALTGFACRQCRLDRASFRQSRLPAAHFEACSLAAACVDHCEMPRAVLAGCTGPELQIRHSDLEQADLRRASLPGASLRRTRLVRADLREANLYGAELYKTVMGETALQGANLARTLLDGAEHLLRKTEMSR